MLILSRLASSLRLIEVYRKLVTGEYVAWMYQVEKPSGFNVRFLPVKFRSPYNAAE